LSYPDGARWNISQAPALAEQIAHPFSSMNAIEFGALVHLHSGEPEQAQQLVAMAEAGRVEQRVSSLFGPGLLLGVGGSIKKKPPMRSAIYAQPWPRFRLRERAAGRVVCACSRRL